jgi:hypothetical protein
MSKYTKTMLYLILYQKVKLATISLNLTRDVRVYNKHVLSNEHQMKKTTNNYMHLFWWFFVVIRMYFIAQPKK